MAAARPSVARSISKVLRGTPFDPFGYTSERRTERKLIADYETLLGEILRKLNADNHPLAVGLAVIPEKDPRLRSCEGAQSQGCEGRRSRASRAIPAPAPRPCSKPPNNKPAAFFVFRRLDRAHRA